MYIIDASAVIAYLMKEPGYERVELHIQEGLAITTVNLTEVLLKLKKFPIAHQEMLSNIYGLGLEIIDYTEEFMETTTKLDWPLRPYLALADKICLGTAIYLNYPVITADKLWAKLDLPIKTHLIR